MSNKNLTVGLLFFSVLGLFGGWLLKNSIAIGICSIGEPTCLNYFTWLGNALFYGSGALAVVFATLLFFPRAFPVWKRFAMWFVPLAAILFAVYPEPSSGDFFSPYPEQVFQWVSALYIAMSGIIIVRYGFEKKV